MLGNSQWPSVQDLGWPRVWEGLGKHRPQMLGNSQVAERAGFGPRMASSWISRDIGNPDARQLSVAERAGSGVAERLGGLGNIGPICNDSCNSKKAIFEHRPDLLGNSQWPSVWEGIAQGLHMKFAPT